MSGPDPTRPPHGDHPDRHPERWSAPLIRLATLMTGAAGVVCAAIGALAAPIGAVLGFAVFALLAVWPLVAILVRYNGGDRRTALAAGALGAASTLAVVLVVGGIIVVFGRAGTAVLPLVLAAAGYWVWTRRDGIAAWIRGTLDRAGSRAQHRTTTHATPAATHPGPGTARVNTGSTLGATAPLHPSAVAAGVSTAALCRAWRETYWLVREVPAGPIREEVADYRRQVLDELERRDPAGFALWLESVPRAGACPGRYLSAAHRPSP